ncbi:MAG: hypothetical protein GXY36_17445 [Chloroflexi bacterium]|nr:hypothetical protein [Chloroflexota bacterium]
MDDADALALLPPLQGCLYCHAEGTTTLLPSRQFLGLGSEYATLKCSQCGSTAWLDVDESDLDDWRIRYRRVNRAAPYYYVSIHLGKAGWLTAEAALTISTSGYVQRTRVQQAQHGDLSWLKPIVLSPPPPLMIPGEKTYLALRGVTYHQTSVQGVWSRSEPGVVLDSGKLYVTGEKIYLLGQRRDWAHRLDEIERVDYDEQAWVLYLAAPGQYYRGLRVDGQLDPQLVAAVIAALQASL